MRTVRITMDAALCREVDLEARKLHTTRSGFARRALVDALKRIREAEMDRRYREGYARHPVGPGEFDGWENEQVWPPWDPPA